MSTPPRSNNRYFLLRLRIVLGLLRKKKISLRKLFNLFYCYVAFQLRLAKSAKSPFVVNFELWNECNSNCVFCRSADGRIYDANPQGAGPPIPKGSMPFEMYTQAIEQLKDYLLMAVLYVNGEPLMYKDLYKAVEFATQRNVATTIATNGILLTEDNSRRLLDAGIDFIKIAVSGFTQEVYSIQHRYGNIERIKNNITMLADMNHRGGNRTVIMIDYTIYNHNRHELELFRDFCKNAGLLFNIRPGNPGGMEDTEPPLPTPAMPLKIPCGWLWKVMTIDWDGRIPMCCDCVLWSDSIAVGSFRAGQSSLLEIWNNPNIRKIRRIHTARQRPTIPICAVCRRQGTAFKD